MRAFIAMELPDAFWHETVDLARQLGEHVPGRYMKSDTYHLTIAFLGNIDDATRGLAMDAVDAACAGIAPIELRSDGLGKFGRARDATLWLGVNPDPALMELARRLREELDARQVPYDPKPFRPHVTLARRARIPRGALPALAFPNDATATDITLFKSELSHEGATYKPLYTVTLEDA
ncbi:MAG: RNA 2',3'-cyclic phosphodiesterase [Coriobacteriia bacterium]|nr:RNA 2',3'-cyclic phosphodiesterase [Coriobacteriia bacterium]